MSFPWPNLADITEQISTQVRLLQSDRTVSDPDTARARLEAIRHFAAQGLNVLDESRVEKHSASVE